MSTRGLYGFRKGGIDKTTYNHSSSYPEWLGEKISKFCAAVTPEQMSDFFDRIIMVDEESTPTKEQQDYCVKICFNEEEAETWLRAERKHGVHPCRVIKEEAMILR